MFVALATVGAFLAVAASPALADNCPSGTCQTIDATKTTHVSTDTSSTSHTKIVEKTTVKAQIRQYQQVKHVVVAINMKANGVSSYRGCVDPVKKGWIKPNGIFWNTRANGSGFWDRWKNGRKICGSRRVKIGNKYYMVGTKDNCGNRNIRIQVAGPRVKHVVKKVITFKTYKAFTKVYEKWITSTSSSTSTSTTTTTYSCPAGWTLNGTQCKLCPPPCPPKAHAYLGKAAYLDGNPVTLVGGEFSWTEYVNNVFVKNVSNAASSATKDLGDFNADDVVKLCETNSGGYTADQVCITHTMSAGEVYTFQFVNRKVTLPPPVNHPPTGDLLPPLHVYVSTDAAWGSAPVCVDNVSDPDGDPVTVSFSFSDQGKPPSAVFTQPGGARCVTYYAPKTVEQVTVTVTLSDDHGHSVTLSDNFPVIPDQF